MKKILVVEDEPITADTISAQLGQLGYSVTDIVLSGVEVIASVLREPPDLVLMDINLGQQDLDGVAIAAQLKSQFRLPVIYLTGRSDEVTLARGKATEPFGFIIKPFTERDLRVAIETALHKHQAEQQLWNRNLIQQSALDLREVLAAENDLEDLKARFVNMASHEFRTPLSVILLAAETLESYGNNWTRDQQIKRIHRIKAAVKYLTKLLDNVFTLEKAKSDELGFQPVEIDSEQFCRDLTAEFQAAQEVDPESPNQVNLIFAVSGKCDRASIDRKLLKEILTHLLTNATKFSGESDTIWFDLKFIDRVAEFTIRDRGIGISEADRAHVFEPFYRSSHASLIPGMGLGLSISKHFATIHGGEISFTSVEHQGSTFTFRLPLDTHS